MTNIPSVGERVESLQVTSKLETNEQYLERVRKIMQQDRTALLTELRESELLKEKVNYFRSMTQEAKCDGHNTLAKAIKAHLDELINSTK